MRILLIHTAFLGDLVLASPLIRAAAELSGRGRVDLVTSPAGAAVTSEHPLVEALFIYDKRGRHRGLAGLRRVVRWIRERRPEVVLLPSRSIRSPLLALAAGVKRRIGFARGLARLLCTDTVPF
ncbi:MAG: glycosyltransferase family 9 protein, partial [Acidobacteriota bacterium]